MEPSENYQDPIASGSTVVNIPSLVKEPDLVTIIEGKTLTTEQLEQEENTREEFEYSDEIAEKTPLLGRSTETEHSFSTSQASLFIPSVQFSLYSSRGHDYSKSHSIISSSVRISTRQPSYGSSDSRSFTITLLEKLSSDGQASSVLALWNVINMIQGSSGMLGLPYAISIGGFPALALVVLVGLITTFTATTLIDCLYEVSPKSRLRKRVRESYAEIAADAWGPIGGRLVDFMTVASCYSTCVLFIMMLGSIVMDLFKSTAELGLKEYCLICACLVLPVVFIKKLSILAWLSMLAVVSLIISIFVIIGFSVAEWHSWSIENIPAFDMNKLPIALGIIVFTYNGHSVFPGIEGSMRNPKHFNKVAYTAFSINTILKVVIGLFCCLLFGAQTLPIVTLNINAVAKDAMLSGVTAVLLLINIYFSYPLNMFVATETLDILALSKLSVFTKSKKYTIIWTVLTRMILVFITLGIAIAVPNFGLLMGAIGSLLGACIIFIFPCSLHLTLKKKHLSWFRITLEVSIIIFGIVMGAVGLVYSSLAIKNS